MLARTKYFANLLCYFRNKKDNHKLTLIIEAIDTVDTGTLMVATQEEEVLWVLDLVCQQQTDGLQGLLASVHIVSWGK